MLVPALFTRISRRPKRSRVALMSRPTAASSVTSTLTASAAAPSFSISATARRDLSALRAATTTFAPAPASPRAIPRPMPPFPPVTIATRSLRSNTSRLLPCKDYIEPRRLVAVAMSVLLATHPRVIWRGVPSRPHVARRVHRTRPEAPQPTADGGYLNDRRPSTLSSRWLRRLTTDTFDVVLRPRRRACTTWVRRPEASARSSHTADVA